MNQQVFRRQLDMLRQQKENLKAKYTKALQQLMHVIKINKSLKENFYKNIIDHDTQSRNQFQHIRSIHTKEIHTYYTEVQQLKARLTNEIIKSDDLKRLLDVSQIERNLLKQQLQKERNKFNETVNTDQKSYEIKEDNGKQEQQFGSNRQLLQNLLQENKSIKEKLSVGYEAIAAKPILINQIDQLKQKQQKSNLQLLALKNQHHEAMLKKEKQFVQLQQQENRRLNNMGTKCQLLESELNSYKHMQKYFEEQSKSMVNSEQFLTSVREQIQKINHNFHHIEIHNSSSIYAKKDEDAKISNKIISLQKLLEENKIQKTSLLELIKDLQKYKKDFLIIQKTQASIETQNQEIRERNSVLEAMLETQKHRNNCEVSDRIQEFQTRMQLILSEKDTDLNECGSFQQTITLKGYIKQLSEELTLSKKRQERLQKKYKNYKKQLNDAQKSVNQKIATYKTRLSHYETLTQKLYRALEQKTTETLPPQFHKQFSNAISHYEQKIIYMSDQIIKINNQKQQLEQIVKETQIQNGILKEKIKSNQSALLEKDRNQAYADEIKKLNNTIAALTQKQQYLQQTIDESRQELIERNQQFAKQQKMYSKNQIDRASLIQKANYLQFELQKQKLQNEDWAANNLSKQETHPKLPQMQTMTQQISEYQSQVQKLSTQLKLQRSNNSKTISDLYVLITELQNQNTHLQTQIKQNQIKINLADNLKDQNRKLKDQINQTSNEKSEISQYKNQNPIDNQELDKSKQHMKLSIFNLKKKNQQIVERSAQQINDLNSQLIVQRTNNITLRNQLESKEDTINELKHQLFTAELKNQRDHFGSSIIQENINKTDNDSILALLVLTFAQVESLRQKNEEMQFQHKENLLKYQLSLKQLQLKQISLYNSNQNPLFTNTHPSPLFHEGKTSVSSYNLDQIPEQNATQSFQASREVTNMELGCFSKASSIQNNESDSEQKQQFFQK